MDTVLRWVLEPGEMPAYVGPLLLDTHIWLWYLEGNEERLGSDVRVLLERIGALGRLRVSDISYWEVAVKTAKRKLVLSIDPAVWLSRAEKAPGIQFVPLERDVLFLSTRLHGATHSDPADRMLMATGQLFDMPIVTADAVMIDYAAANPGTRVVDARA